MKIDAQLDEALQSVRQDNAHRMNRMRAVGTAAFVVVSAISAFLVGPSLEDGGKTWLITFYGASIYFVLAVLLLLASRTHAALLALSRSAIPLLDIPVVVALQAIVIVNSKVNPGHTAHFTVALLACYILIATFTLDLRKVVLTVGVAVAGELFLQHLAGIGVAGRLAGLVIFGMVTWICIFAGANRIDLVTRVTRINARRARLQRYFSPGVGELIEQHEEEGLAEGRECELTIMFTDIRGFTRISENLSGREIVSFLNQYHARMVEAVFRHGGTLDKYLGDGLMIYFNAPITQTDHARRAIQCALLMQREIQALNEERSWHGPDQLKIGIGIGIGIHSGHAVLGDIGAPHRREFTAIGDAVNVAARLQEMTKDLGEGILASEATARLTGDEFEWNAIGQMPIRNRDESIEVLTPRPRAG